MSRFIDIFGDYVGMVFERDLVAKGLILDDVSEALHCGEIAECKMEIPEGRAWGIRFKDMWTDELIKPVVSVKDYENYYLGKNFEYGIYTGCVCQNVFRFVTQQYFTVEIESVLIDSELVVQLEYGVVVVRPLSNKDYLKYPYEFMLISALNMCPLSNCDFSREEIKRNILGFNLDLSFVEERVEGVVEKEFLRWCLSVTQ